MGCHRNGDWARDLDFDMTTSPQNQQATEIDRDWNPWQFQANPELMKFADMYYRARKHPLPRDEHEKYLELLRELTRRLAGPSIPVIEREIRRVLGQWDEGDSYKDNWISGDTDDLVERLTDLFHELQSGKVE